MMRWIGISLIMTYSTLCAQSMHFNDVELHIKTPKNTQIEIKSPQINSCQDQNLCLKAPTILYQNKNDMWRIQANSGKINPQSGNLKAYHVDITPPLLWSAQASYFEIDTKNQVLSLEQLAMTLKHYIIKGPRATVLLKSQNLIISGPWTISMDVS